MGKRRRKEGRKKEWRKCRNDPVSVSQQNQVGRDRAARKEGRTVQKDRSGTQDRSQWWRWTNLLGHRGPHKYQRVIKDPVNGLPEYV